jgi:hypothetical protein
MHEQPLENIAVPPQMGAAHPAGLIEKSIGSFQQFTPLAHQALATLALDAPPIGILVDFTLGTHPISTKGTSEIGGAKRRSDFDCLL